MDNFIYDNHTRLIFGKDGVKKHLKDEIGDRKNILLHYGKSSIKKNGLYDEIKDIFSTMAVNVIELSGVEPNPKLSLVYEGIKICKENDIDLILAVGGGSVIDSAKAIATGALYDGDVWDFFEGKRVPNKCIPIGTILTLPATGSEASTGTVVTKEEGKLKRSFGGDFLRPEFSILDAKYTLTLSDYQTFAGITDMISHILERYFTNTENTDLTDRLCEGNLKAIIENAYKLKEDPQNLPAREEIMLSGTTAHCGILGIGREEDWASHNIGHEMTALYGTTHGRSLSIIFPAWMRYLYKEHIEDFIQFGERVFDLKFDENQSDEEKALQSIEAYESFLRDIDMPITFKDEGLDGNDIELMAEKATMDGPLGNYKKLYKEDVIEIYKIANREA